MIPPVSLLFPPKPAPFQCASPSVPVSYRVKRQRSPIFSEKLGHSSVSIIIGAKIDTFLWSTVKCAADILLQSGARGEEPTAWAQLMQPLAFLCLFVSLADFGQLRSEFSDFRTSYNVILYWYLIFVCMHAMKFRPAEPHGFLTCHWRW